MFVRLTKDTIYLTANEGQKFRTVFSENAPLQKLERIQHCTANAILSLRKMRIRLYFAQAYTSTGSACSVYLEGTRSHNEWRVSTLACYLLL